MARFKWTRQQQHVLADAHVRAARAAAAAAAPVFNNKLQTNGPAVSVSLITKLRRRVPIFVYQFVLGG